MGESPMPQQRKISAAAAIIVAVMEDQTPPAPVVGPVGRGVDWAAALERHGRWLRRVVLTRLGERQAVDEVMQEVSLAAVARSEEHTSELQSQSNLVCRLLLEKKKKN